MEGKRKRERERERKKVASLLSFVFLFFQLSCYIFFAAFPFSFSPLLLLFFTSSSSCGRLVKRRQQRARTSSFRRRWRRRRRRRARRRRKNAVPASPFYRLQRRRGGLQRRLHPPHRPRGRPAQHLHGLRGSPGVVRRPLGVLDDLLFQKAGRRQRRRQRRADVVPHEVEPDCGVVGELEGAGLERGAGGRGWRGGGIRRRRWRLSFFHRRRRNQSFPSLLFSLFSFSLYLSRPRSPKTKRGPPERPGEATEAASTRA